MDLLSQQVLEAWVQFDVVFPQVAKQLVRPQDLGDSDQLNHENKSERVENSNCEMFFFPSGCFCWSNLIVVVLSVEEGLFLKDHTGQHAAQAPHVQTVVIHLKHTSPTHTPTPVKAWLYFFKM